MASERPTTAAVAPSVERRRLPTMYDLPSEDPKEPGLPDEFHYYQPQLLRETFQPPDIPEAERFVGTDINLYYDPEHCLRYKRPDWFAVIGVPRFYDHEVLRLSYVVWDEGVPPYLVVELLSPGTDDEDLGTRPHPDPQSPPGKWQVYEGILAVPHYVVYDRVNHAFRYFKRVQGRYREQDTRVQPVWFPEIRLGLGQWEGSFRGHRDHWLRWFDRDGRPLPNDWERVDEERRRADEERRRAEAAEQRVAELEALLRGKTG